MITFKAAVIAAMVRRRASTLVHRTPASVSLNAGQNVTETATFATRTAARTALEMARRRTLRVSMDSSRFGVANLNGGSSPPPPPTPPPSPGGSYFIHLPIAFTTICLAILAHKAQLFMQRPPDEDVFNSQNPEFIQPELLLLAGHLLRSWTKRMHPGSIIEFLPPLQTAKSMQPTYLMDESDEEFLGQLNSAYPPLIALATTSEGMDEFGIDRDIVNAAMEEIAGTTERRRTIGRKMEDIRTFGTAATSLTAKNTLSDLHDSVHILASTILNIASEWVLSAATLQEAVQQLVPARIKDEMHFLREYLQLCVEANEALDLPLVFPSEVETDSRGAVVKLRCSMWVVVVRAVARSLAAAVVAIAPFLAAKKGIEEDAESQRSCKNVEQELIPKKLWGLGLPEDMLNGEYEKMVQNGFDEDGVDAW